MFDSNLALYVYRVYNRYMNETLRFELLNPERKHYIKYVLPHVKDFMTHVINEYNGNHELRMRYYNNALPKKHNFHTAWLVKVCEVKSKGIREYHFDLLLGENDIRYIGLVTETVTH